MRYTSWDAITARYPGVAKIAQAGADRIESTYIDGAEAELDARLAARYVVPLASTPTLAPSIIQDIATDLAYHKIAWMTLPSDQAKALRDYIEGRILGLVDGVLSIVSSGTVLAPVSVGVWGTNQSFPNIANIDPVEDWRTSDLAAEAAEDTRLL